MPNSKPIVTPPETTNTVMIGVIALSAIMALGIVSIVVFGDAEEQRGNVILFITSMSAVIAPLVGLIVSKKVDAVNVQVNGRMTQLLEQTAKSSHAEGKLEAHTEILQDTLVGGTS